MPRKIKKLAHVIVGVAFAGFFLYWALRGVDPERLKKSFLSIHLVFLLPMLGTLVLFFWLKTVRWSWLLRPLRPDQPLRTREVFPALIIGFMGNNVLPAHLGEFVRMYVLGRQYRLSKTAVLSTIVLERVLDFLAIIAIFAVALQFIPTPESWTLNDVEKGALRAVRQSSYFIGGICLLVFLMFVGAAWQSRRALQVAEWLLKVLPVRLRRRCLETAHLIISGLQSLRSPWVLCVLMLMTLVHWGLNGLGLYLAALSFPTDAGVPLVAALFLLSITALGVTVPSAPGYAGTIQLCFVVALGVFGVERETALAASVYAFVVGYLPVTLTGLYFLERLGLKLRTIRQEAEVTEESIEGTSATAPGSGDG
jgi:uncharacterized protein (TIRG00374 family)